MPLTTNYKFGDVVLVGFPFTNQQTIKKRPAVIISNTAYQQTRPDVIVLAITSQIRSVLSLGEYLLQDWQQAGLLKPSLLKPLIATLEQTQIIKTMGQLSTADKQGLQQVLKSILNFGAE